MPTPQEEALDPNTPAARLAALAAQPALAHLIAQNPGAPLSTLLDLAERYPEQVLQNPAFPLFALENPNFLWAAPAETLLKLLSSPCCPEWIQTSLAHHPSSTQRSWLARNPNTQEAALRILAEDPDEHIRSIVASHQRAPGPLLQRLASDRSVFPRRQAAANPRTPPGALRELLEDHDYRTRLPLALNPSTSVELLCLLAMDSSAIVRNAVARNPNTPAHILRDLCDDANGAVRDSAFLASTRKP